MEPQEKEYVCADRNEKECKMKGCLGTVAIILLTSFAVVVGILIGSVVAATITAALASVIVLAIILGLLLILSLVLMICCKGKEKKCKFICCCK